MATNNNSYGENLFLSDSEDFLASNVNQSIVPETQQKIVKAPLDRQPKQTQKINGRPKNNKDRKEFARKYALTNYFRAFERCLMYVYNKLKEDDFEKLQEVTQSKLIDQISSFVQEIDVFLKMLELLISNPFPQLSDYIDGQIRYSTQLIKEIPSRTVSFAFRKLKQLKKGMKNPTINEVELKSIVIGTILLVGVGKIDLSTNDDESSSSRFQRIVNNLLRRSKLMSQVTMTYLIEYWDSIISLVLEEKVSTVDEEESEASHIEFESKMDCQKYQRAGSQSSYKMNPKQEEIFLQEDHFDLENDHAKIIHDEDSVSHYISDQVINRSSSYFENFHEQISMSQLEKVQEKLKAEEKKKKPVKKIIENQTRLLNIEQSERSILQKRAVRLFNYYKKGSRKAPQKKSSRSKKDKKPHPSHEKRQIDTLIDFILEDEFVIAYAMSNHIYHGLQAEGLTLEA